jgi:hypothetical protein
MNKNFACKAIDKAQKLNFNIGGDAPNDLLCEALTDYIQPLLSYDDARNLIWVDHPSAGRQVALWMMSLVCNPNLTICELVSNKELSRQQPLGQGPTLFPDKDSRRVLVISPHLSSLPIKALDVGPA